MFDQMFSQSAARDRHNSGPLAMERVAYLTHLANEGMRHAYLRKIARCLLVVADNLRLAARPGQAISHDEIDRTANLWANRKKTRRPNWKTGHDARSFFRQIATGWLGFLGRLDQRPAPAGPDAAKVSAFAEYMVRERGLSPATIRGRCWCVKRFLGYLATAGKSLEEVTLVEIDELFVSMLGNIRKSRVSVQTYASHVRAFLRFAEMRGWRPRGLVTLQSPRVFAQASLPIGPSWDDVQRLLATTDGDRPRDIRDRAILMLLAVYGFRAGEVRRLRLDDFDWEREQLTVACSKTRRTRTYPLCRSVGDAVLRYLKAVRPHSANRQIFLSLTRRARPLGELWPIIAKRLRPLGLSIPHHGPHALRHACATHLLAQGLSLKEIGDHLGHEDPDTTRIYAKVNLVGLRQVADFDLGGLV
jgi:site-specific recombinase XerD